MFVLFGWSLVAYLSYKVANAELENTIYDPFQILGIKMVCTYFTYSEAMGLWHSQLMQGTPEKEIKSHFKKLSKL
jgi:translocation protein SEC63